ncbi:hypothetical protein [Pacificibacter marinus]|uniref:hypothetical protein n=1 Tax=Pacificibacter marinus TaxID=658057 RepID=UPI001C06F035|nr:hypothetical protein [Pacificibacter marinus]MBU2867041.1 hypothetical protein [Pacificibacter marinus]
MTHQPPHARGGSLDARKSDPSFLKFTPMATFIPADTVAEMIGFSCGKEFLRNRARLERDHDFPLPIPTCQSPMKWRTSLVNAWAATQGLPASQTPPTAPNCNKALLEMAQSA